MSKPDDAIGNALRLLREREGELQQDLERVRAAISAIGEVVGAEDSGVHPELKDRTYSEAAELILREAQRPLHVREIVERLRKRGYKRGDSPKKMRASLVGSLARKVRKGETFASDKSGVYSLLRWESSGSDERSQIDLPVEKPKPVDAILQLVEQQPGMTSIAVADELEERVQSESPDPRKVVLTIIGQLVQQQRLGRDEEGRLFLKEED